jgi:hypothetical protein
VAPQANLKGGAEQILLDVPAKFNDVIDSTSSDMLGFPGNKIASTIMWNGIGNEFR